MKISGGNFRGRKLQSPDGKDVRPTPAIMREAYFNILAGEQGVGTFLDIFAGTGAMGLEALSRGAPGAVFVERDRGQALAIQDQLQNLALTRRAEVWNCDAFSVSARLKTLGSPGAAWLAPPYAMLKNPVTRAQLSGLIAGLVSVCAGPVAMQVPRGEGLRDGVGYAVSRERAYGSNAMQFYVVGEHPAGPDAEATP